MSEHAPLSPSAFGRWSKCPGSIKACKGLPNESSPAAQWGTDAHQILEDMVNLWLNPLFFNEEETLPEYDFDDVEEKTEVAQVGLDYMVARYTEAEKAGLHPVIMCEQRVYLDWCTNRDDIHGSGDIIIITDKWVEIIDLKAGAGIVVEPTSGQLRIYGLGTLDLHDGTPAEVICTIVQPRIPHDNGLVRSEHYPTQELMKWCNTVLIPAAKATDNPDAERIPGEDQCHFCLAKATCPAVRDKVEKLAMSVFEDNSKKTFADLVNIEPANIPMENIVEIIENAPLISGWVKSIEAYAKTRLMNREEVPGYKLVRSGGKNQWRKSEEETLTSLTEGEAAIDEAVLTKTVMLSAPQALKLKNLEHMQREHLACCIKKSEGSLALVPITDKRADAFPTVLFNDMSFLD